MKGILIIEDDEMLNAGLCYNLQMEGYEAVPAFDANGAWKLINDREFALVLMDVNLPDGNGFTVCTEIRQKQDIPVIFLTASGDEASVVTGLNMGADDYVTKPFRPRELIARIGTALRKYGRSPSAFELFGLQADTANGVVKKDGKEVFLSALEYRLLLIFINNPKSIITRNRLLDELWDAAGEFVNNNTLTVYIKRLREKIEDDPANPKIILTVHGTGYRLGGSYVSE